MAIEVEHYHLHLQALEKFLCFSGWPFLRKCTELQRKHFGLQSNSIRKLKKLQGAHDTDLKLILLS